MRLISAIALLCCASACRSADTVAAPLDKTVRPVRVSRASLSGLGLERIEQPDQPGKEFFQKAIYFGPELGVFVVSTNSYANSSESYPFDEYVYMLHGAAEVRPAAGRAQRFESRDHFVAPKGHAGEWQILAGENLHYELSVISSQRSEATVSRGFNDHVRIAPRLLSGVDIQLAGGELYEHSVFSGAELNVSIKAERPRTTALTAAKEKLVHVLSGQITVVSPDGSDQVFQTGAFFVIPKGLGGTWRSEGHGIVKYLVVERAW